MHNLLRCSATIELRTSQGWILLVTILRFPSKSFLFLNQRWLICNHFSLRPWSAYRGLNDQHSDDPTPFWRRRRYFVVMMAFFGLFNVYALRVNLSVAIVAMTEIRTVTHANGSTTNEQYFPWDSIQKGYVLSSFFYGYLCTQVIGGIIAQKIGGSLVRREKNDYHMSRRWP